METFSFKALGTEWMILSDGKFFDEAVQKDITEKVALFEERFSRFKDTSEVNAFREVSPGAYEVSSELAMLLERAQLLRTLTQGHYDSASGVILEHMGYDKKYRFTQSKRPLPSIPTWSIKDKELQLSGPTAFDLGGMGKEYCIDMVAGILATAGYKYYLVDGGGDMYATTKADGSPYTIALEWPGRTGVSYGTVTLRNQGLAVSDTATRRFSGHHHIVDAETGANTERVLGAVGLGATAWDADSATAALMQWPHCDQTKVEESFGITSIIITQKQEFLVGTDWPGEVFRRA